MPPRRRSRKRRTSSFRRPAPSHATYDRVLVVCEGSKTEPNYIRELKNDLRINSANLTIIGDGGSAPETIVQSAIDQFSKDRDFDSVFCVFDKDEHAGYNAAVDRIRSKRLKRSSSGNVRFRAITSVPCFEYWLLLHFVYTDAPFERTGSRTAADSVVRELLRHIPGYTKGGNKTYGGTCDDIDTAIDRSQRALAQVEARGGDNPSTRVHELVSYLKGLTPP